LESLFKIAENYFNNNYIISSSSIKEGFNKKNFSYNPNHVKNFIELENNLCAACFNKNPEITIYDLTSREKEKFSFVAHLNYVNWIINSSDNKLISCGSDGFIKIWPNINEHFQIENSINVTNNTKKRKIITLNPIYVYKCESKEMKGIIKMIGLNENRFIAVNHAYVFLFKYTIKENNIIIEIIKNYACFDLIDINTIKKDNNEIIVINSYNYLSFLNIPNFETISKIRIASMNKNNLIQINSSEILILQGIYFTIFDLNKYKIELTIKNKNNCDYLLMMGPDCKLTIMKLKDLL
jgi:WD40 repeat protein